MTFVGWQSGAQRASAMPEEPCSTVRTAKIAESLRDVCTTQDAAYATSPLSVNTCLQVSETLSELPHLHGRVTSREQRYGKEESCGETSLRNPGRFSIAFICRISDCWLSMIFRQSRLISAS